MPTHFIGTDIGGTFTDCVAVDETGVVHHAKSLSTKRDPAEGMNRGLEVLAESTGHDYPGLLRAAHRLSHGTTIGTNIAVERTGSPVGLITTRGHRDALFMMRGTGRFADLSPEQIYNIQKTQMPLPLVPRDRVLEIDERIDSQGRIVVPLDEERAAEEIRRFLEQTGVESVAISLLWSFRNPRHELAVADIVRRLAPDAFVSVSSEISPRVGEYERVVATVLNSYVGPTSTRYLERTANQLADSGLQGPFLVMQASGGVVHSGTAAKTPITLIGSGPAGGLVGSATLAKAYGHRNVIATDMGGTSFDVGLIVDQEHLTTDRRLLGKYAYQQPAIDVRSIACGGGSIARFDEHSHSMRVGPASAGSEPGPACYDLGGELPTVTDADVVLGFIRPEAFLDGRMRLNRDRAVAAVEKLAKQLGTGLEEAAAGIIQINNNNAATLIRQQTLERGYDTRDFVIYAFGGAGPLHAYGIGPELGVQEVLIPLGNGASTLSAYGIASSPITQFFEREVAIRAPFDADELRRALTQAEEEARAATTQSGADADEMTYERIVLMRYTEQRMHSLAIGVPPGEITGDAAAALLESFDSEYARQYGEAARVLRQTAEVFAVRIRAVQPLRFAELDPGASDPDPGVEAAAGARLEDREVFWPTEMKYLTTAVYDGERLPIGVTLEGPVIIELPHTGTAVARGQRVRKDRLGSLRMSL
ncbi:hydantoinase/oxoprolinase family protein [Mycolicibacterium thermoresistibile]